MSLKVTTEVTTPRNHIMRRVVSAMLGAGFGPAPLLREGILSPASPPNRQRQRGEGNAVERTEAHTHLKSRYHERYHGPAHALDRTPLHLLYLLRGFFCLAVVSLAACETTRPIDGKDRDCVGVNGQKDSTLVYEYSTRNIIIGLFSAEFIVPPVIVVLKDLECPKRKRVR